MLGRDAQSFNPVDEALKIVPPSWPLQNAVAVNPWWFFRNKPFVDTLQHLSVVHGQSLLADQRRETQNPVLTLGEYFERYAGHNWNPVTHLSRYCSAYLDERQASAPFPWRHLNFFTAWLNAQKYDRHFELLGFQQFRHDLAQFEKLSALSAIDSMLGTMGIQDTRVKVVYMQRLMANILGWASQFKYCEWQRNLGYPVDSPAQLTDLLAVAMAYDFLIFKRVSKSSQIHLTNHLSQWIQNFAQASTANSVDGPTEHERNYQVQIARQLLGPNSQAALRPVAQMAFCIDVRSEVLRRHIERNHFGVQTLGFAGFFGLAFDFNRASERQAGHRLPVLLAPAFAVDEVAAPQKEDKFKRRLARAKTISYFRNLRKNPLSSFLYVELFGLLYVGRLIGRAVLGLRSKLFGQKLPHRFDDRSQGPGQVGTLAERVNRAETVLRHMGLVQNFAPLVCLVGHGSVTTNNAFGSTLDCGACGGHAGDVNARFLADMLNDRLVRTSLGARGIQIPTDTDFVAAVHETVTDEIYFLDSGRFSEVVVQKISTLKSGLKNAAQMSRLERIALRPHSIEHNCVKRSHNWSETRPEWALAGNASFVIAPRSKSRGVNLAGRSFLHDYDWTTDAARQFKTLELILTAPMVVTNWINLQYYASTVAPKVYGAGSKVLHNLVNETGVIEGNGGDLKIGLPLQSVHDGQSFVHEALRLSVFVEAPLEAIEDIIARHEAVRGLVEGEWLFLIHINPLTGQTMRRTAQGTYTALN